MEPIKISRKVTSSHLHIDELKQWLGKEVEIVITEKKAVQTETERSTAAGMLASYQDPELMKKEEKAWEKAMQEKHGNS